MNLVDRFLDYVRFDTQSDELTNMTPSTKALTFNEVGAYRKFVNRGSESFLCKTCLAAKLNLTVEDIDRKIEQFKAQGCTLFV